MSRPVTSEARAGLETPASPAALLGFLTIEHAGLGGPLHIVSDVTDYLLDGHRWQGLPFDGRIVSDGDGPARSQLVIEAVEGRLAAPLRSLRGRALVTLEIRSTADFDLATDPREPLVTVPPIYAFRRFDLRQIACTATELTGTLMRVDQTAEPWPSIRATEARFEGLFW